MYVATTLVQEGSTSRWAAICHVLPDMTSHVIPHVAVTCGQTRPLAYSSTFTFTCNATRTVPAETEELQVHVRPVLSMHVPLCIPGQVSVSFLASPLPSFPPLFVCKASRLGHEGMEGRRVSSWPAGRCAMNSSSVRTWYCQRDNGKPSFEWYPLFSPLSLQFKYDAVLLECD